MPEYMEEYGMKKVYLIGGTMGVGKTTVCQLLKAALLHSVFLDGDWCWDMHPFQVTDETKKMVMDNICHLLNNFIKCSAYENIVFCWVMHEQSIINEILSRIDTSDCVVKSISLICEPDALTNRLQADVDRGVRTSEVIARSIARIPLYKDLNTIKIDVSRITAKQAAEQISRL
jgi:broad-specificity NMP kinase